MVTRGHLFIRVTRNDLSRNVELREAGREFDADTHCSHFKIDEAGIATEVLSSRSSEVNARHNLRTGLARAVHMHGP